jgi:hypothetical protein
MRRRLRIKVTEEDILRSRRNMEDPLKSFNRSYYCPIASAANREFPGCYAFVGRGYLTITYYRNAIFYAGMSVKFSLSRQNKIFMRDFDVGKVVKPAVFILERETD